MDAGLYVFIALAIIAFFATRYFFEKGRTRFDKYKGEFKDAIGNGLSHLYSKYPLEVEVLIAEKGSDSNVANGLFGKPMIVLCEEDMRNEGWIKDFNLMARLLGFKELKDLAQLLLFHEYRHHLVNHNLVKDTYVPDPGTNYSNLPPYFMLPEEYDCYYFAFKELEAMR